MAVVAWRLIRQDVQGRSTARRRVFERSRIDLHQEGSSLGGYPELCWNDSIAEAEAACSYWITGITTEINDLVGCISWTGYTSLGVAGFAVASSTSPIYSSDEGINSNSVISIRKRSSFVGMDGRELRSSESYEGSHWSSPAGAKSCNHQIRQLRPKKTIPCS